MTEPVTPTPISPLPPAPLVTDTPAQFDAKSYPFVGALDTLRAQVNVTSAETYQNAVAAKEYGTAAVGSVSQAAASAAASAASAVTSGQSATAAAQSATAAEGSAISASKLNLGGKATPPTVDNQGQPLLTSATYFDTTLDRWRVWSGTAWTDGVSAVAGVSSVNGLEGDVVLDAETVGAIADAPNDGAAYVRQSESWQELQDAEVSPVGTAYIGTQKPPTGTWVEGGLTYLQSSYPDLFAQLGHISDGTLALTTRTSAISSTWRAAQFGGGVFVAFNASGAVAGSSPDGITWTQRTLPVSAQWTGSTYGNGTFVTVGGVTAGETAITSPDGITWTQRTLPVSANWSSVTFGNGLFVAVARNSNIAITSPDGITWTQRTLPVSAEWSGVAYGNGLFVAVVGGANNTIAATSPDGITWVQQVTPSVSAAAIAYGGGMFVATAGGTANTLAKSSPDGITWTQRTTPSLGKDYLFFANGMFVAHSSQAAATVVTSMDGITWLSRAMPSSQPWTAAASGNGLNVFLVNGSTAFATAPVNSYAGSGQFWVPNPIQPASINFGYKQWVKAA